MLPQRQPVFLLIILWLPEVVQVAAMLAVAVAVAAYLLAQPYSPSDQMLQLQLVLVAHRQRMVAAGGHKITAAVETDRGLWHLQPMLPAAAAVVYTVILLDEQADRVVAPVANKVVVAPVALAYSAKDSEVVMEPA
jgi:hypothetical protein